MAYFPDLSPYLYTSGREHRGVVNVGWLSISHSFPEGEMEARLIEKLKILRANPVQLMRGRHICEFCSTVTAALDPTECHGNGEIRVRGIDLFDGGAPQLEQVPSTAIIAESNLVFVKKTIYAAPVLIVHYIEAHGYLPPKEFLDAVEAHFTNPQPPTDCSAAPS